MCLFGLFLQGGYKAWDLLVGGGNPDRKYYLLMDLPLNQIILGDCLEVLKTFPDKSIDLVVTDPPYELGFMGKSWDNTGIANSVPMWKEVLRVLKPGGHLFSFGGTRTYHRMASAIEDAGFEIRDMGEWLYGSGFPKSLNIGKAVKAYQETGGSSPKNLRMSRMGEEYEPTGQEDYRKGRMFSSEIENDNRTEEINNEWEGWGTALKPAHEPFCIARKPISENTVAENVLKHGVGGLNIDESRVGTEDNLNGGMYSGEGKAKTIADHNWGFQKRDGQYKQPTGRFPANLIHDGSKEVVEIFPNTKSGVMRAGVAKHSHWADNKFDNPETYGDEGSAARFFYCAKASKSERNMGLDVIEEVNRRPQGEAFGKGSAITEHSERRGNHHPTVKPLALMEYLIKLASKPGQLVLDPFAGSGTTCIAAKMLGGKYIGIEKEKEYVEIAKKRLEAYNPMF